ncbi:MAG: hydrolase [Pseudomonas sp.]
MRTALYLLLAASLIGGIAAYTLWIREVPPSHYLADLRSQVLSAPSAANAQQANLLAIRPQLYPSDYRSPALLRRKLSAALDQARQLQLLNEHSVVALPDQIGTWLLLQNEKPPVYAAHSFAEAQPWLALNHPLLYVGSYWRNQSFAETLLRDKAADTARAYQQLFSELARDYRITLMAGSLLLPEPSLEAGQIRVADGPLQRFGLIFSPHGQVLGEPYRGTWPDSRQEESVQKLDLPRGQLLIKRAWDFDFPLTHVSLQTDDLMSVPLFIRGHLWAAPLSTQPLTPRLPRQPAKETPGSHLFSLWPDAR